jgi:hypothetical protein
MYRRSFVAAVAAVALLAGSGLAWADDADIETDAATSGDTFFTYGYDVVNHLLVTGIHPVDAVDPVDCTVATGEYDVGYGTDDDGTISVETVEQDGVAVVFPSDTDGEVTGVAYDDDGNPCTLEAIVVAGPNGQVNHGQVVSAFSRALDIAGKGCVMRWIAQSGFGKGDAQVQTGDVDPMFAPMDTGTIDLVTVMAACDKGSKGDGTDDEAGEDVTGADTKPDKPDKPNKSDKAKKDAPGKPESPGNSGNAPGHNK